MIRRLIDRLLRRRPREKASAAASAAARPQLVTWRASEHGLRREDLPSYALKTCEVLQQAGFRAFIVGGGVRDTILKLRPKDFDVATSATPEQVTKLFRRARLIGRRFQIVHVMYGRDMVEVSTFRALQVDAETDAHGRVLRDNVWGTLEEDAARRDFTINALYYDPIADTLLDFHGGVRDLESRVIRMIGDPTTRYREDPVRMLRSARFAAKLEFTIEEGTRAPIRELAPLIHNVPPARLFDEMLKLLQSGHALNSLHQLRAEGLHHGLLPLLDVIVEQPDGERFIQIALTRTDERVARGLSISPGFLFATLLWQQVRLRWQARLAGGEHMIPALMDSIDSVVDEQCEKLAIQKRIVADMREIWSLQPRFDRRNGRTAIRLLEHMRFRAGYDFLMLRVEAGEAPAELGDWWTRFVEGDHDERETLMSQLTAPSGAARRRRRRKPSGGSGTGAEGADDGGSAPQDAGGSQDRDTDRPRSGGPPAGVEPRGDEPRGTGGSRRTGRSRSRGNGGGGGSQDAGDPQASPGPPGAGSAY